jgi:hypothetical protein
VERIGRSRGHAIRGIRILHAQTVKALAAPVVRDRLAAIGIEEMGNSPKWSFGGTADTSR